MDVDEPPVEADEPDEGAASPSKPPASFEYDIFLPPTVVCFSAQHRLSRRIKPGIMVSELHKFFSVPELHRWLKQEGIDSSTIKKKQQLVKRIMAQLELRSNPGSAKK